MTEPGDCGASWYASTLAAAPARGPLSAETDVDVCIIGGGLAGLTAARELARRDWSVVVLEARRIAWNASGRNTGSVLPGFSSTIDAIIARVGLDHAKALWAQSVAGAEYVRGSIRELRMPGVEYGAGGWLHVSKTDNDAENEAHANLLAGEFGAAVEYWPRGRVRATLKSPLYFSAVHHRRAFTINPLNYALGLAAAAEAHGARIHENSVVLELDPGGVRKRVTTATARLRARHVVLAGNVHIGALMPALAHTLLPISSYVIVTAPLGERLHEAIAFRGAVSDTDLANNHYRVVGGDRLMWSGRSTVWAGRPRRRAAALTADIARAYPQLGKVAVDHAWSGTLGNPVHRMPQIGELLPGVWLLSGFGGHGLNTTAMGGNLVARAIAEGDDTWRLFTPFELIWAGGALGRTTAQIYSWTFARRERIENWRAQRREAARPPGSAPEQAQVPPAPPEAEVLAEEAVRTPRHRRRIRKPRRGKAKVDTRLGSSGSSPAAIVPGPEETAPADKPPGGVG
jgi:glycine/D-amino acid oxidase-like deaminating enzyme